MDAARNYDGYLARESAQLLDPRFSQTTVQFSAINLRRQLPRWATITHSAAITRIFVIEEGEAHAELAGYRFNISRGMVLLCPPGVRLGGHIPSPGAFHSFNLYFNAEIDRTVSAVTALRLPLVVRGPTAEGIRGEILRIGGLEQNAGANTGVGIARSLTEILWRLAGAPPGDRVYPAALVQTVRETRAKTAAAELVGRAVTRVREQISGGTAPRVSDVAEYLGVSTSRLARAFASVTGQNPSRYIEQLRISQAQSSLRHTELPINRIAAAAGFDDPYHFSRVFKRVTGHSPSEYRDQAATSRTRDSVSTRR